MKLGQQSGFDPFQSLLKQSRLFLKSLVEQSRVFLKPLVDPSLVFIAEHAPIIS